VEEFDEKGAFQDWWRQTSKGLRFQNPELEGLVSFPARLTVSVALTENSAVDQSKSGGMDQNENVQNHPRKF
jgi:hypothetical protein